MLNDSSEEEGWRGWKGAGVEGLEWWGTLLAGPGPGPSGPGRELPKQIDRTKTQMTRKPPNDRLSKVLKHTMF